MYESCRILNTPPQPSQQHGHIRKFSSSAFSGRLVEENSVKRPVRGSGANAALPLAARCIPATVGLPHESEAQKERLQHL